MKNEPDRFWKFLVDPAFLHRAAHLIDKESRGDFYDSYLERQVATHRRDATINDLVASLSAERYMPSAAAPINVPKSTYSQRPGTILPYRDRIVLQAIIMCLAPGLDEKLSSNVWSWRVRRNLRGKGPEAVSRRGIFRETDIAEFPFLKGRTVSRYFETFEPWYALWPRFEAVTTDALKRSHYKYMVISDISGYYENIQISILEQLLHRNEPLAPRVINLLMAHLRAWQISTHDGVVVDRGIPQNNSVSSFLGNFYLKPVDDYFVRTFERSDALYFRYMDDIRILAKDRLTARRAALALESQIRRTKLNLQSAKTKILPSGAALKHIADSRIPVLEGKMRGDLEAEGELPLDRVLSLREQYNNLKHVYAVNHLGIDFKQVVVDRPEDFSWADSRKLFFMWVEIKIYNAIPSIFLLGVTALVAWVVFGYALPAATD